jgi:archaellum component FlaC
MLEKNKLKPILDHENRGVIGLTLDIDGFDFTTYFYPKKRSITWIPSNNGILNIRLIDEELIEEFTDFYDVIEEKLDLTDPDESILLTLKTLFRQREKLHKSATSVTRQEAMGLFGELTFLKEKLKTSIDHKSIINGWRRPDRSTHDFDYGEVGYEIKSIGLSTKTVTIQNENQLDKLNHQNLYLVCYRVECFPSTVTNSIDELVSKISKIINSPILNNEILEKIDRDLDEFKFDITAQFKIIAEIDDHFPKITSKKLDENISGVKYQVSMSYIEKHGEKSKMAE